MAHLPRAQVGHTAIGLGASCLWTITSFLLLIFMPTYANKSFGIPLSGAYLSSTVGGGIVFVLCPVFGCLSDRFGRRTTMLAAAILLAAAIYPSFAYLGARQPGIRSRMRVHPTVRISRPRNPSSAGGVAWLPFGRHRPGGSGTARRPSRFRSRSMLDRKRFALHSQYGKKTDDISFNGVAYRQRILLAQRAQDFEMVIVILPVFRIEQLGGIADAPPAAINPR